MCELGYTLCVVRSFQLYKIVRYRFWDMNWAWPLVFRVHNSGKVWYSRASQARLGKKTRNARMVVREHLAQASVSRLSENP